ncbi:sulfite exporter TauE/SafE family protein [Neobacillus kokaensis]|uniref:Probable membrane transporter protein n=1 Tax=Neobacillus kokaensis TaxID=2759023 RepID=A0ABQ3MYR2_9BACI|nr:sulfite exporter TauE/SafE family protein [Neobacillus kokaensis]GHH97562.1 anion permease [Neobacillus kokaensis]
MDITTGMLLSLIGILSGAYGSIVGAGGGFIFVPALLLIYNLDPVVASGTGLIIVLVNSLSGVIGYGKQKRIQYRTGLMLAIGAIPGSLIGVWLLQIYSSRLFYIVFASLLVLLGFFLFAKNSPFAKEKKGRMPVMAREGELNTVKLDGNPSITDGSGGENTKLEPKWIIPLGLLMGVLSSYLGIGGGWLLVPILIYFFKVSTHFATATSIFSLCLYTSVGVISQIIYGNIDWEIVLWGGFGVIIGAQLGVFLSQKIPGRVIVQMLSVLLVAIGFRMFFN